MTVTVADLKAMAADRILALAEELAPGGRRNGGYWMAKSPLRADRHAGSFAIWITGNAIGAWKDFSSGDKGDIVDLIAQVKFGGADRTQRADAIRWLRHYLGLANQSPRELSQARAKARREQTEREAREARERGLKITRAMNLWLSGKPLGGTLGEDYLASRGIFPREIPNLSNTFRFLPALDYWRGDVKWRGPAIVGRYRAATGAGVAIHGTWLREDGRGKAPLSPPKLSFAPYKGAFLPVTRGASGKEIWDEDCPAGPVVICEGPEDAWSMAQANPELRVWAAGSLSNFGNLPMHPKISAFLVVRQNDWDTPAAVKAFDQAIEALRRGPAPVEEIACGHGKDPNDQLRGV